jgi:hypothetical protein
MSRQREPWEIFEGGQRLQSVLHEASAVPWHPQAAGKGTADEEALGDEQGEEDASNATEASGHLGTDSEWWCCAF